MIRSVHEYFLQDIHHGDCCQDLFGKREEFKVVKVNLEGIPGGRVCTQLYQLSNNVPHKDIYKIWRCFQTL